MNKKGQTLGVVLTLFILITVGIVFINEIAKQEAVSTTKSTITNQSIDITSAKNVSNGGIITTVVFNVSDYYSEPTDWRRTGCPFTSFTLKNASGVDLTLTTDYVFTDSIGNFTLKNTFAVNGSNSNNNFTYAGYTNCRAGYNKDDGARSVAGTWTLFASLALLGFVVVGMAQWLKQY